MNILLWLPSLEYIWRSEDCKKQNKTIFSKFIASTDIGIAILKLFCIYQRTEQTAWVCWCHWQLGFHYWRKAIQIWSRGRREEARDVRLELKGINMNSRLKTNKQTETQVSSSAYSDWKKFLQQKEPGLLGEMVDYRTGVGKGKV